MIFSIHHKISFNYTKPVYIEPTVVRLKPRTDVTQRLISYGLTVDPEPEGVSEAVDLEGSSATYLWLSGEHDHMTLEAHSQTETLRENPFAFVLTEADSLTLPLEYPIYWRQALKPYYQPQHSNPQVHALAQEILGKTKGEPLKFLNYLTETLHGNFRKIHREDGEPIHPTEVLKRGEGACRDLSLLFMEICREVGLAARYVSGYTRGDDRVLDRELHAWPEIYLPGGGWRGYDPTIGLAVANHHVALAASVFPELTLPTAGTFRGSGVQSKMNYDVKISIKES